jgi:hypothetical protein
MEILRSIWQETQGYAERKDALKMEECQKGKWQEIIIVVGLERMDVSPS